MKKILVSLTFGALACASLKADVNADVARLEVEMKHHEAEMHKHAQMLTKAREEHAIKKSRAEIDRKSSERRSLSDRRRS
jgi:hypothetical protein